MTFQEFRRLRLGDEVYSHFGNAYRCAVVTELFDRHLRVEADAVKGGKLTRIAKYKSVDTRDTGRLRQGRSVLRAPTAAATTKTRRITAWIALGR